MTALELNSTPIIAEDDSTVSPRMFITTAHRVLERHWVTMMTLLILAVALAVSMHFPSYIGPLHGHPGR
jgi:hypothetical protein